MSTAGPFSPLPPSPTSSTSSFNDLHLPSLPPSSSSAIGRKVAASLQLFKESGHESSDHPLLSHPPTDRTRETQPVGRLEWPEREVRKADRQKERDRDKHREAQHSKSSPALERARTRNEPRNSQIRLERTKSHSPEVFSDLLDWQVDSHRPEEPISVFPDSASALQRQHIKKDRGRTKERERNYSEDRQWEVVTDKGQRIEIPSPPSPPLPTSPSLTLSTTVTVLDRRHTNTYKSPQPQLPFTPTSRSSRSRVTPVNSPFSQDLPHSVIRHDSQPQYRPSQTASPTAPILVPSRAVTPYSPWTTDDETWDDSASVTTYSTATTYPRPESPDLDPDPGLDTRFAPVRHTRSPASTALAPAQDTSFQHQTRIDAQKDEDADDERDLVDLELPHVPLKPFRNQVGGHSAIYKFTKRAVCKASIYVSFAFFFFLKQRA